MCDGSGVRPSPTTGSVLKAEREQAGLGREAVAPYFYKVGSKDTYSLSYVVDLEADKRAWSMGMVDSYREAIKHAVKARNGNGNNR